jgi:hypothetical protein
MHIVEIRPYDHLADRRSGQVEHTLKAQVIDSFPVYMSWTNTWDEEVAALFSSLRFTDINHETNAAGVT